jgi:hypothetical protein
MAKGLEEENQEEGRGVAPSMNSVERPDLEKEHNLFFLESSFIFRVDL